jgi:nicotinate-nucleotide adenylyltransferase
VRSPGRRKNCSPAAKNKPSPVRLFRPPKAAAQAGAIGILGGIFDPVHNGHLALAALACGHFKLSKLLFVPSGHPPHKPHVGASAADRLAMLRLALRSGPAFTLWDEELRRKGTSYTFDTLRKLTDKFHGRPLYFIIGSDNLTEIETWYRYREVLRMVTLCVVHRPGYPLKIPRILRVGRIETFSSPELDISSTAIREYVAQGRSWRSMVPEAVRKYISKRKLYTELK